MCQGAEDNKVRVPDVRGMTEMDATAVLTESGLSVGNVTETPYEDAAWTDMVCYQSYSVGSYVDKGTVVDLRISTGHGNFKYTDDDLSSAGELYGHQVTLRRDSVYLYGAAPAYHRYQS